MDLFVSTFLAIPKFYYLSILTPWYSYCTFQIKHSQKVSIISKPEVFLSYLLPQAWVSYGQDFSYCLFLARRAVLYTWSNFFPKLGTYRPSCTAAIMLSIVTWQRMCEITIGPRFPEILQGSLVSTNPRCGNQWTTGHNFLIAKVS